jgi:coenzyme F420-0:L-glutamate ligase/coenzyme F420-1:gamma-L-glutamate ligase
MKLTAFAFENFPEVIPNSNLSDLIINVAIDNEWAWCDGDIIVIAQKIISKSENQFVYLADVQPGSQAEKYSQITGKDPRLIELILSESNKVLRTKKGLIIVQHKLGFICANAGIDHSNVLGASGKLEDWVLLLPKNPDKSASSIREEVQGKTGKRIGVIIIDSHGRPWRRGVVGLSIGSSGVPAVVDRRGTKDRYGYQLKATEIGTLDELAAAASILMGQADEGRPVVVIRGFPYSLQESNFSDILRNESDDLFR